MPPRKTVTNALVVLAAALLGGVVALGGAAVLGQLGTETHTVINQSAEPIAARSSNALTVHEIYRRSAPGVVRVLSTSTAGVNQGDPFGFAQPDSQQALGSGFVIDKEGHIVTNYHVVQGAEKIQVSFGRNDSHQATIVGTDPSTDLAVLKVDVDSDALTPLPLGDSDHVQVGDGAVAIGSPFGLARTATAGIVSAINRRLDTPGRVGISDMIQTDAPINHGNSGGPLLNTRAQVIGVNTQIETGGTSQGNVGIGFAVSANTVKSVVAQILENGKVEHAWLGISGHELSLPVVRLMHLPVSKGVLVEQVFAKTGAKEAGLKGGTETVTIAGESYGVGGDIIVAIDGKPVGTIDTLRDTIAEHKPGDEVELEIYRGDDKKTVTVTLGEQPEQPSAG